LISNGAKARLNLFGPRLVIDMRDTTRAIGMVSDQSTENHHGATARECNPIGCEPDLEQLVGKRDPVVGGGWLKGHGCPS
jgi:hypothetical protein